MAVVKIAFWSGVRYKQIKTQSGSIYFNILLQFSIFQRTPQLTKIGTILTHNIQSILISLRQLYLKSSIKIITVKTISLQTPRLNSFADKMLDNIWSRYSPPKLIIISELAWLDWDVFHHKRIRLDSHKGDRWRLRPRMLTRWPRKIYYIRNSVTHFMVLARYYNPLIYIKCSNGRPIY